MTEKDYFWENQRSYIERYSDLLADFDYEEAEKGLEAIQADPDVHPHTMDTCQRMFKEALAEDKFWLRESLMNIKQMHV